MRLTDSQIDGLIVPKVPHPQVVNLEGRPIGRLEAMTSSSVGTYVCSALCYNPEHHGRCSRMRTWKPSQEPVTAVDRSLVRWLLQSYDPKHGKSKASHMAAPRT